MKFLLSPQGILNQFLPLFGYDVLRSSNEWYKKYQFLLSVTCPSNPPEYSHTLLLVISDILRILP
jgi:hypothetical protein